MKYKIYIPTKGRYDRLLTADYLAKNEIDFLLVVEKKEADLYREKYPNKVIELPDSDYGSVYFARNFIKKLSIENGEKKHWQLDDDIKKLMYVNKGEFLDIPSDEIFTNMENFCDRFKNIGLASPQSSVWVRFAKKPFEINKLVYTCKLINNNLDIWWNKDVIDDVDYNIQVLNSGWCTIRFNTFSFAWSSSTTQKGGFTEIYLDKNRINTIKNTQEKWGLGKINEKTISGNIVYTIDYTKKLREYNQKLIPDFDEKYLKNARKVTQEFIETYGTDWTHIDDLDDMIAEAIKNEVKDWLEELYVQ
jgi:hypothetical protein